VINPAGLFHRSFVFTGMPLAKYEHVRIRINH